LGVGVNFLVKSYSKIKFIGYISSDIGKINLNIATKEMLLDLPGIGERLAERIIEYRNNKGEFKDIEELKNIKGIGEAKYEEIKDYFLIETY
jgi:competence protein ComEA